MLCSLAGNLRVISSSTATRGSICVRQVPQVLQITSTADLAERKGLSGNAPKTDKINDLTAPPLSRLYQGNVPLSSNAALNGLFLKYNQTK